MSIRISRRHLLLAGGSVAGAAALSSAGPAAFGSDSRADPVGPDGFPATSEQFDLVQGSKPLFKEATLREPRWYAQTLAFDDLNGAIYFTSIKPTTEPNGDIWLTKTDLSGRMVGSMALHGFGHGTQLGVQPTTPGGPVYLWSEADFSTTTHRARRIVRFPFKNGGVIEWDSPGVEERTPPGMYDKYPTASIDPGYGNLIVGYNVSGAKMMVVYDLADASSTRPSWTQLASCPLTKTAAPTDPYGAWQGIAVLGRYLYLLQGPDHLQPGQGYFTTFDLRTQAHSRRYVTRAFGDLPHWEPEGMAVTKSGGQYRLCFGISSWRTANEYRISVAYKDRLL